MSHQQAGMGFFVLGGRSQYFHGHFSEEEAFFHVHFPKRKDNT